MPALSATDGVVCHRRHFERYAPRHNAESVGVAQRRDVVWAQPQDVSD